MSDGTYRGRWLDEVFGTPRVSAEVKVLLLAMAMSMDESGQVSVPRKDLAGLLRCAPRNVTAKQKSAIDAGLLERTSRGHHGKTAEFRALLPGIGRVTTVITQPPAKGDDDYHPFEEPKGDDDYHPSSAKGDDLHPPTADEGGRQSSPHTYSGDSTPHDAPVGVVVRLFDEDDDSKPSLRSQKRASARRGGEHPAFAAWYAEYPKKKARAAAVKAFAAAVKKVDDPQVLIDGVIRYRTTDEHVARGFIKNPATWLNGECWLDEIHAHPRAAGEHRPFTNPTDQSVYDEDI